MCKVFNDMESLFCELKEDKDWSGEGATTRNRYPLRFVLFESFSDFFNFINESTSREISFRSIDRFQKDVGDDNLMTYSQLAKLFQEFIAEEPVHDMIIAPFSEIARFYENSERNWEFNSLVKTIRLTEASEQAQAQHQRIYVPIIGMQGKMDSFKDDVNIHIWEYDNHSSEKSEKSTYRLILTPGTTYDVKGLDEKYSLCDSVKSWLSLWQTGDKVHEDIICSSKTLYNNACYAQPDNAFEYVICENAYEFLCKGLGIFFGEISYSKDDKEYWEKLAGDVDARSFDFASYVGKMFNIRSLNRASDFLRAWVDKKDDYSRWLLKMYYMVTQPEDTYLKRVLKVSNSYGVSDLLSSLATQIFEEPQREQVIAERLEALQEGAKLEIKITEAAENIIKEKLCAMAVDPEVGYGVAMKYISPISASERFLMIEWLGEGHIGRDSVRTLYPEFYNYSAPFNYALPDGDEWVNIYFSEYRKSKISNAPSEELRKLLAEKNGSPTTFSLWRESFKTVKTLLSARDDIDVYYWIDGLGVDWVPFIKSIIEEHKVDNVYLNDIQIATAELPTCTENNKIKLQEICGEDLPKIGDLDKYAHEHKEYPKYIDEEFSLMKKSISSVLAKYNGKKIAFVSDHGISYMASHGGGMSLAKVEGNHNGRCGEWKGDVVVADDKYVVLDDGKHVCALTYDSLTSKVPTGMGAHGGATPEEVLVPIIIVSSQKNATSYSVELLTHEISASSPIISYVIKGLSSVDNPVLEYNDIEYRLESKGGNIYESERVNLVDKVKTFKLKIGTFEHTDTIVINMGVEEDENFFGDI